MIYFQIFTTFRYKSLKNSDLEGHVRLDGPKFFLYRIQGTHQKIQLLGIVISLHSFHMSS